jgi:hypothetical protein
LQVILKHNYGASAYARMSILAGFSSPFLTKS